MATRESLAELPDLLRLAARVGVREVYVQRLVYFAQAIVHFIVVGVRSVRKVSEEQWDSRWELD